VAAGATYTPIATTTGTGSSNTVTFSSISSSYTDLVLIANMQSTDPTSVATLRMNNDSTSTYSYTTLYGSGTTAGSFRGSTRTGIYVAGAVDYLPTSSSYALAKFDFINYSNTSVYKTVLIRDTTDPETTVGLWRSASAINRIDIFIDNGNFTSGSTFTLYGIAAA
jgi:hypothetical protein